MGAGPGNHAVVIGGQSGRPCAPRGSCSDFYDRVTVYGARRAFPERPRQPVRKCPRADTSTCWMARGAAEFDTALFPGLLGRHGRRRGADTGEPTRLQFTSAAAGHVPWHGHDLAWTRSPPTSRAGRIWKIGQNPGARVDKIPNVEGWVHAAVSEPRFDATGQRVDRRGYSISGDAVGRGPSSWDAAGRGQLDSRVWLEQWGLWPPPREGKLSKVWDRPYATHQVHIPEGLLKEKVVVAGVLAAQSRSGFGMPPSTRDRQLGPDDVRGSTGSSRRRTSPRMCERRADRILPESLPPARFARAHPIGRGGFSTSTPPAGGAGYDQMDRFPNGINSRFGRMRW